MIKINLLPWRDESRIKRRKEFVMMSALVVIVASMIMMMIAYFYHQRLQDQLHANQTIIRANQALDQQLKSLDGLQSQRQQIIERMALIQSLQSQRPIVVRLIDELVRMMPTPLFLTQLTRKDDQLVLIGHADNPNTVAEFLRNLERSPWYRNALMNSFVAKEKETAQNVQGIVIPVVESGFGDFVVTVDITEPEPQSAMDQVVDRERPSSEVNS
ncbi:MULTISPECIES: PilN domain-containing protein [unclassified Acinetobacter]|uniref:PilN domain-containing protein n=1 Tax=unclassified Acinetobacter TaxID=196816 RepID=UPI002934D5EC|nr:MULTISPECIES: PilN domain-containing protein [unclassified Acinetobacter]WOE31066.1 PilN domain-containing protein [Acinetobacter sp. SAAs470]WOE39262.1 PilN domain-containing protein [Acinetobacter sp. SAAs474]